MSIKVFGAIATLFLAFFGGYNYASLRAELSFTSYQLEYQSKYNALLQSKMEQEAIYAKRVSELETERINTVDKLNEEHAKTIANLRRSFKPSGVSKCTSGGSTTNAAKSASGLICYSEEQLRDRIEKSLAIGTKCDELATNYNSLLRLIEGYNATKRQSN